MRVRRETDMKRAVRYSRGGAALLLSALLAVPLAVAYGGASAAQAADGRGAGKSLLIGVAADGFNAAGTGSIDIEASTNPKYPGTVRFTKTARGGYVSCLATDDRDYLQWTGCNSDASKHWVIEPLDARNTPGELSVLGRIDNTVTGANVRAGSDLPRFVIRNFKYPDHCVATKKSGLHVPDAAKPDRKLTTTKCSASDTEKNLRTQHAIINDPDGSEWEFLRQQMVAGAQALAARKSDVYFSGGNLWVKPLDATGNPIGAAAGATGEGYFSPRAIMVDPQFRDAIVSKQNVVRDCAAGGLWWSVYNGTADPMTRTIGTDQQHTDSTEFGVSVTASGSWESGTSAWVPAGSWSFGLEVGASKTWGTSDSTTKSDSISYTIPAKRYGMAVVSTETTTVRGLWMSGTAVKRVWNVPGIMSVASKNSAGVPLSELSAYEGNEQKSCLADGPTTIEDGAAFEVTLPGEQVAPLVGDTVAAEVTFVQPAAQGVPPLDVRYQWYADKEPIVGQTARELVVKPGYLGKQLSFSTYENGGSMRFESERYSSLQTAPVLARASDGLQSGVQGEPASLTLPDGMVGTPYEVSLGAVEGIAEPVTLDDAQLPAGLVFDPTTETISGTPTGAGRFDIVLETAGGDELVATVDIDTAPTVWPGIRGKSVRVDSPFALQLVSDAGTDASYDVEFLTSDGQQTSAPDGVRVVATGDGAPVLEGASTQGGEWLVRTTERSPHHDAGDGRATSDTVRLSVDGDAALVHPDGARLEAPLGVPVELQLVEMPAGADPAPLTGALPPGMSFDPATGVLSGAPAGKGAYPLHLGPTVDGDSGAVEIVVFGAPEISIERRAAEPGAEGAGSAAPAGDLSVGEFAEWGVLAPHADEITATVRRTNGTDSVGWAALSVPGPGEAHLDAVPSEPGRYVMELRASNAAGTSTQALEFVVQPSGGGSSGSGNDGEQAADAGAEGEGSLSSTGSDHAALGTLAALALLLVAAGAVLTVAARRRRGASGS